MIESSLPRESHSGPTISQGHTSFLQCKEQQMALATPLSSQCSFYLKSSRRATVFVADNDTPGVTGRLIQTKREGVTTPPFS